MNLYIGCIYSRSVDGFCVVPVALLAESGDRAMQMALDHAVIVEMPISAGYSDHKAELIPVEKGMLRAALLKSE
jgi:hypothetical protein